MERSFDIKPYKGELKLDCDGSKNIGARWYASHENARRARLNRQKFEETQNSNKKLQSGFEVTTAKFPNPNGYQPRFQLENLDFLTMLGEGRFGQVWMAKLGTSDVVAIKQFDMRRVSTELIWKERDMLIYLKHNRVCNILGAFCNLDAFLILECCYSNLTSVMYQVSPKNALRFGVQLAEALMWIHHKNIIHCDLRPDNCLLTTSNNLVLSDFSNAVILPDGFVTVNSDNFLGHPEYQDFESNQNMTYSFESDMFSFACVLFEMLTKHHLIGYNFSGVPMTEILKIFTEGRYVNLYQWPPKAEKRETLSDRITRLAIRYKTAFEMLICGRKTRWSAESLLTGPFLKGLLRANNLSLETLDNDLDAVTIEHKHVINKTFALKMHGDTDTTVASMFGFYYDEKEIDYQRVRRKALVSHDAHVAARFLVESNAVCSLEKAVKRNDPAANAQLINLIKGWTGNPFGNNSLIFETYPNSNLSEKPVEAIEFLPNGVFESNNLNSAKDSDITEMSRVPAEIPCPQNADNLCSMEQRSPPYIFPTGSGENRPALCPFENSVTKLPHQINQSTPGCNNQIGTYKNNTQHNTAHMPASLMLPKESFNWGLSKPDIKGTFTTSINQTEYKGQTTNPLQVQTIRMAQPSAKLGVSNALLYDSNFREPSQLQVKPSTFLIPKFVSCPLKRPRLTPPPKQVHSGAAPAVFTNSGKRPPHRTTPNLIMQANLTKLPYGDLQFNGFNPQASNEFKNQTRDGKANFATEGQMNRFHYNQFTTRTDVPNNYCESQLRPSNCIPVSSLTNKPGFDLQARNTVTRGDNVFPWSFRDYGSNVDDASNGNRFVDDEYRCPRCPFSQKKFIVEQHMLTCNQHASHI